MSNNNMQPSKKSSFDYYSSDEEDDTLPPPPPPPYEDYVGDSPPDSETNNTAEGVVTPKDADAPVNGYYRGLRNAQDFEEEEAGMDEIEVPSSSVVARMEDDEILAAERAERQRKFKIGAFILFAVGAILSISLGTAGAVRGSANKTVSDTEEPIVTAKPTLAPTPWLSATTNSEDPLLNEIQAKFLRAHPDLPEGTAAALIDNTTPQYKAMKWTLDDTSNAAMDFQDKEKLQMMPDVQEELVQRFAASTLYFSLHAEGDNVWTTHTDWMSEKSVCEWHGITCGNGIDELDTRDSGRNLEAFSGRETVTEVKLTSNNLRGRIPAELGMFSELKKVELYANWITGSLPEEVLALPKLEVLDVDDNLLSGAIPPSIANLKSIQNLYLSANKFTGTVPIEIGSLTTMKKLWLHSNELSGVLPAELGNLVNLEQLDVEENAFTGVPDELSMLQNLKILGLSKNPITTGPIPEVIFNIGSVEVLTLSGCGISSEFPSELSSLSNLRELRMNKNNIIGQIPENAMSKWPQMRRISLEQNDITGPIPADISDMKELIYFDVFDNGLTGDIPDLPEKLVEFKAFNNGLTSLPSNLGALSKMQTFDVANNELKGELDISIGTLGSGTGTERNLEELYLSGNNFEGELPLGIGDLQGLKRLEIDDNGFEGSPDVIGNLIELEILDMKKNNFGSEEFPIPVTFGNLVKLRKVDLSVNVFVGEIPAEIGNLVQLEALQLSRNWLSGEIPEEFSKLTLLRKLHLDYNLLSGEIPDIFDSMDGLEELKLNANKYEDDGQVYEGFRGRVPESLYDARNLVTLRLDENSLRDGISEDFANLLRLETLRLEDNDWRTDVPLLVCEELINIKAFTVGCDYDCDCCTDEECR